MKVASKMALGSALLIALLIGVLLYQTALVRRLAKDHEVLSAIQLRAALTSAEMIRNVDELVETTRKFFATRDPAYRTKAVNLRRELLAHFRALEWLARRFEQDLAASEFGDTATDSWADLVQDALPHDPPGLAEGAPGLTLKLEKPELEELLTLLAEPQKLELLQLLEQLEALEKPLEQAQLVQLEEIHHRAQDVLAATRAAIDQQIALARAASRRAERIAWGVVLAAMAIALLVTLLTARSINEPLRRLIEGTRAVAEGRFTCQLETGRDDEFARLASSFNRMVRRLDELDQLKKHLVAQVSHELKTPLAAMQETSRLLLDLIPGPLNQQQSRLISLNLESSQRLSAMIAKMLDLSRMEAGGLALDCSAQDLAAISHAVVQELSPRLHQGAVTVKLQAGQPVGVHCDRDRIFQVVENLLENALKHSPPESVVVLAVKQLAAQPTQLPTAWQRKLRRRGPWGWLSLQDQGPGVPDQHKELIFQKFHQVRRTHGVGLGLAICREIVDAHGGAIWVCDHPSGGSVFHLLLPASVSVARALKASEVAAEGTAG